MNADGFVVAGVKLLGLLLIANTSVMLSNHLGYGLAMLATGTPAETVYWLAFLPMLPPLAIGALFWMLPVRIGHALGFEARGEVGSGTLLKLGIVLLGLFLLFSSISDIVFHYVHWVNFTNAEFSLSAMRGMTPDTYASVVASWVELLVALAFIFGAGFISQLAAREHALQPTN